jgi:hypothetical protein
MCRLLPLVGLIIAVAGCGPVPLDPSEENNPVSSYHFSHSRTYGELAIPPFRTIREVDPLS